jgi:hypothetical protein
MKLSVIVGIALLAITGCATSGGPGNNHPQKYQVRVDTRYCHEHEAKTALQECWRKAKIVCPASPMEIAKGKVDKRWFQRAIVIDCLEQDGFRVQLKDEPNWF